MQARLQVQLGTENPHQRAQHGETGSHRQYIGKRQQEAAHATRLATQNHAGQYRQHRQYAGSEGQAQAGEKEQRHRAPGQAAVVVIRGCGVIRGGAVAGDAEGLGFGGIAEALICAALVADLQGERPVLRILDRQLDIQYAVVDLDFAEVIVGLLLACGHSGFAECHLGIAGLELEAVSVEVIAFGRHEAQRDLLRGAFHQAQAEGFTHR